VKKLWLVLIWVLTACADPARNLYEGIKASNDAKRTPMERATQPTPDYDAYQKSLESDKPK